MVDARTSLNKVRIPPNIVKEIPFDRLKSLNEDEDSFYEFFEGLNLQDVSSYL